MNPRLARLQPYPFEKLAALFAGVEPDAAYARIALSIGEPQHPPPELVIERLRQSLVAGAGRYPTTKGLAALRLACADWAGRRFGIELDPEHEILPVSGTREGLFSIAQVVVDSTAPRPTVIMPNPFYQIYEGAALLAGAEPVYLNATAATGFAPELDDVPAETWRRCQLVYVCSPNNPSGTVLDEAFYTRLLKLSDRYGFVIVADECYTELFRETPPVSLLEVCVRSGRDDYERCIVSHSLSKRSSVPGLRSGFVAGDRRLMAEFLRFRTYHGCSMSEAIQQASIAAWNDDRHAAENRMLYNAKYAAVVPILNDVIDVTTPPGSFYLWPDIGGDDETFARELYRTKNVVVLAGSYLSRECQGVNPGRGFVRLSLVPPLEQCIEAAERIRDYAAGSAR